MINSWEYFIVKVILELYLNNPSELLSCYGECREYNSQDRGICEVVLDLSYFCPDLAKQCLFLCYYLITDIKKHNPLGQTFGTKGGEFTQEYGKLAELRSIFPNDATFVAFTATSTTSKITKIMTKLEMIESVTDLRERTLRTL